MREEVLLLPLSKRGQLEVKRLLSLHAAKVKCFQFANVIYRVR